VPDIVIAAPPGAFLASLGAVVDAHALLGDSVWLGSLELAGLTLHPLSLVYAVSGSAMISTLRIPKI